MKRERGFLDEEKRKEMDILTFISELVNFHT